MKGRNRVVAEQFLAWSVIAGGGPTLRAVVRGGSGAASAYWSGSAGLLHLAIALAVGAAMACVFGVLSWNRMERMYAEATNTGVRGAEAGPREAA